MRGLFDPESPVMQALSRVYDLAVLNIVYLLTCVPIVTIGAANAGLYTVCFRLGTEREEGLMKTYFRAFRENFRQGTVLFLALLLFAGVNGVNLWLFSAQSSALSYLKYLAVFLLVLAAFVYSYAFPLLSQFRNSLKETVRNALLLSIGYLPRTFVLVAANFLPLGLLVLALPVFLQIGFLWFVLYFSAAAYLNALLLRKVFAPFMPKTAQSSEHSQ